MSKVKEMNKEELKIYVEKLQIRILKAIEYIESNEKEYGSLEDNEKIILNILRGEDNE